MKIEIKTLIGMKEKFHPIKIMKNSMKSFSKTDVTLTFWASYIFVWASWTLWILAAYILTDTILWHVTFWVYHVTSRGMCRLSHDNKRNMVNIVETFEGFTRETQKNYEHERSKAESSNLISWKLSNWINVKWAVNPRFTVPLFSVSSINDPNSFPHVQVERVHLCQLNLHLQDSSICNYWVFFPCPDTPIKSRSYSNYKVKTNYLNCETIFRTKIKCRKKYFSNMVRKSTRSSSMHGKKAQRLYCDTGYDTFNTTL